MHNQYRSRKFLGGVAVASMALLAFSSISALQAASPQPGDWPTWRGPDQNGTSNEEYKGGGMFPKDGKPAWTYASKGRGAPIIVGDRLYSFGYRGEFTELEELLTCLDANTGDLIWEKSWRDYISDTIYDRYSIGSPAYDYETGNVYIMATNGLVMCYDRDGNLVWDSSLIEEFGKLTFPNGRTGAPVIDGDIVIVRGVTTFWGKQGPPSDRFYAFHKKTGEPLWASTPGVGPPVLKDSSFSTPVFETRDNTRVFYAGTGCGNVVCINALTGKALWRWQFSIGGVNASPVLYKDSLIVIHGTENLDTTDRGRMAAIKLPNNLSSIKEQVVLGKEAELWRAKLKMFTSSPTLVGDRVYQTTHEGTLACVDAQTGKILWDERLGPDNLHSSPLAANGLLYVPIFTQGSFFVVKPSDTGLEILNKFEFGGNSIGSPALSRGKVYLHTTEKLFCFDLKPEHIKFGKWPEATMPKPGKAVALKVVPNEVLLTPGATKSVKVYKVDANGVQLDEVKNGKWAKYIPPTAKVKAKLDADFSDNSSITAIADAKPTAGMFKVTSGELSGFLRGRVLPTPPFKEDLEASPVASTHPASHPVEPGVKFGYPPLPWIGARFKWEVREMDGNKVLAKTLDKVILQRATTFIGDPQASNYTITADVMTDGNRRIKSDVGVVNQRYLLALKGNQKILEVSSNQERLKVGVPFVLTPKVWYRIKCTVESKKDGSTVVRGKAWRKDEKEPEKWTIEVPHAKGHKKGAPGIYGFSPNSKKSVFVDNISVVPNK